VRIVLEKLSLL